MTVNVEPYLAEGVRRRQRFEESYRIALQRERPADWKMAMADALTYVNNFDGLIAALMRDKVA